MTESRRAFIGFSLAMGDVGEVAHIAARHGLSLRSFRSESFAVPHEEMGAIEVFRQAANERGEIIIDLSLMELVR